MTTPLPSPPPQGPLAGIRVLDLTTVVMGPYATLNLGDMGADVIKVESLDGDSTRNYRPLRHAGMSGLFLTLHRNKRSIALDLKAPEGLQALMRMVRDADVILHNLRPGAAARLGLSFEAVAAQNPRIIYCVACGFGSTGPYRDKAAYDDLIQAACGLSALTAGTHDAPRYLPTVLCDKVVGQTAAIAILAALVKRGPQGAGQYVEVPMLETMVSFTLAEHMTAHAFSPDVAPLGWSRILSNMRKPFKTRDGYACILPYSDKNWRDFFAFVGRPDLAIDPRYATLAERIPHIDTLYGVIAENALLHSSDEWVAFCDQVGIPAGRMNTLSDLWHDEHLEAVGMFEEVEHPTEGRYKSVRHPVTFGATPASTRCHAPNLGEHTVELLHEAGYGEDQIAHMLACGTARQHVVHSKEETQA